MGRIQCASAHQAAYGHPLCDHLEQTRYELGRRQPENLRELGLVVPKPDARFVIQHAEFGYTANLPLTVMHADNFLLATHFNGQVLSPEHGYPLRGVVGFMPGRRELKTVYFWKGAKWLRGIEFVENDKPGFWEQAGYHNDADVWKEERVG